MYLPVWWQLRNKRAYVPLSHEDDMLYATLCRAEEQSFKGVETTSLVSSGIVPEFYQGLSNVLTPCKVEWERMPMASRALWLKEHERVRPENGDRLVAVNGHPAPRGIRRIDVERGTVWYDHSKTYLMLHEVQYRHSATVADNAGCWDRFRAGIQALFCLKRRKPFPKASLREMSASRLRQVWRELFDCPGRPVGERRAHEARVAGAADALELAMNEYDNRHALFGEMKARSAMATATRIALVPWLLELVPTIGRRLERVVSAVCGWDPALERAKRYLRSERIFELELCRGINDDEVVFKRWSPQGKSEEVTISTRPERSFDGRSSFYLRSLEAEISIRESEKDRARRKLEMFLHQMMHDVEVEEWMRTPDYGFRTPETDEVTLWLEPERPASSGQPKLVKLTKGRWKSKFTGWRESSFPVDVPTYIKNLTDAYDLKWMAWESVECVRKILLLSSSTFIAPGTTQISFGMVVCIFSIAVYVHIRPYNARQTDWLQQICQLVLFTTLLLELINISRGTQAEAPALEEEGGHQERVGWMLISLTAFAVLLALPMVVIERPGFPYWLQGQRDALRVLNDSEDVGDGQYTDTAHVITSEDESATIARAEKDLRAAWSNVDATEDTRPGLAQRLGKVRELRERVRSLWDGSRARRRPKRWQAPDEGELVVLLREEHVRTLLISQYMLSDAEFAALPADHELRLGLGVQEDAHVGRVCEGLKRIMEGADVHGLCTMLRYIKDRRCPEWLQGANLLDDGDEIGGAERRRTRVRMRRGDAVAGRTDSDGPSGREAVVLRSRLLLKRLALLERIGPVLIPYLEQQGVSWETVRRALLSINPQLLDRKSTNPNPNKWLVALLHPDKAVLRDLGRIADDELTRRLISLYHSECAPSLPFTRLREGDRGRGGARASSHRSPSRGTRVGVADADICGGESSARSYVDVGWLIRFPFCCRRWGEGGGGDTEVLAGSTPWEQMRELLEANFTRIPWADLRQVLEQIPRDEVHRENRPGEGGRLLSFAALDAHGAPFMPESGPTETQWAHFESDAGKRVLLRAILLSHLRSDLSPTVAWQAEERLVEPLDGEGSAASVAASAASGVVASAGGAVGPFRSRWVDYVLPAVDQLDVEDLYDAVLKQAPPHGALSSQRQQARRHGLATAATGMGGLTLERSASPALKLLLQDLLQALEPKLALALRDVFRISWKDHVMRVIWATQLPDIHVIRRLIHHDQVCSSSLARETVLHSRNEVLQAFLSDVAEWADRTADEGTRLMSRKVLVKWLRPLSSRGKAHWADTEEGVRALSVLRNVDSASGLHWKETSKAAARVELARDVPADVDAAEHARRVGERSEQVSRELGQATHGSRVKLEEDTDTWASETRLRTDHVIPSTHLGSSTRFFKPTRGTGVRAALALSKSVGGQLAQEGRAFHELVGLAEQNHALALSQPAQQLLGQQQPSAPRPPLTVPPPSVELAMEDWRCAKLRVALAPLVRKISHLSWERDLRPAVLVTQAQRQCLNPAGSWPQVRRLLRTKPSAAPDDAHDALGQLLGRLVDGSPEHVLEHLLIVRLVKRLQRELEPSSPERGHLSQSAPGSRPATHRVDPALPDAVLMLLQLLLRKRVLSSEFFDPLRPLERLGYLATIGSEPHALFLDLDLTDAVDSGGGGLDQGLTMRLRSDMLEALRGDFELDLRVMKRQWGEEIVPLLKLCGAEELCMLQKRLGGTSEGLIEHLYAGSVLPSRIQAPPATQSRRRAATADNAAEEEREEEDDDEQSRTSAGAKWKARAIASTSRWAQLPKPDRANERKQELIHRLRVTVQPTDGYEWRDVAALLKQLTPSELEGELRKASSPLSEERFRELLQPLARSDEHRAGLVRAQLRAKLDCPGSSLLQRFHLDWEDHLDEVVKEIQKKHSACIYDWLRLPTLPRLPPCPTDAPEDALRNVLVAKVTLAMYRRLGRGEALEKLREGLDARFGAGLGGDGYLVSLKLLVIYATDLDALIADWDEIEQQWIYYEEEEVRPVLVAQLSMDPRSSMRESEREDLDEPRLAPDEDLDEDLDEGLMA